MIQRLLTGLPTAIKPQVFWLTIILAVVVIGSATAAVVHTLNANLVGNVTGSVTVPISGGIVANQLTPSQCMATDSGDHVISSGGACGGTTTVQDPIKNTGTSGNPILGLNTPLAIGYGGTGTASPGDVAGTGITLTGSWPTETIALTTPVSIANGGTGSATAGNTYNSPLSATGSFPSYTVSCSTCLTTVGGQTLTASGDAVLGLVIQGHSGTQSADILDVNDFPSGGNVFSVTGAGAFNINANTSFSGNLSNTSGVELVNFMNDPSGACQTNAPIASICIGSPTPTIAIAVGKVSGNWGGTTSANGGEILSYANVGSGDRGGGLWETSAGVLDITSGGSGTVTLTNSGGLVVAGPITSITKLGQNANNEIFGSCTMTTTTCTVTWAYTPVYCQATPLGATAMYAAVGISGTTETVTANTTNTATWDVHCM